MNQPLKWEVWLMLICMQSTAGFYHEPSMKKIANKNLTDDCYFGYSITYQANTKRLIVGAPKANVVGQVYTFDVDSNVITPVPTPKILLDRANETKSKIPSQKNFLLGASVKAGSNFFVMCAPKNTADRKKGRNPEVVVMGLCFVSPTNGSIHALDNDAVTNARFMKPYGWSVDVTATDAVIVGAPAMYEGIAKVVKNGLTEIEVPRELYGKGFSFGYSVASGNYLDATDITSSYYAISTPIGTIGLGEVFFFDEKRLKKRSSVKSYSLNSLFGASLCTANLGVRRDSLLIGAPTYTDDVLAFNVDRGAVYLYVPDKSTKEMINIKTIEGQSDGAYFGNSIANLGDLDGDRKDEIAIGAPYEDDGRGAVYIYSGARLLDRGLQGNQMLIQRIQPESNKGIRSFGFSLTPLQDYDENGCNELAVGAPGNNSVVLYRCFSSIIVNVTAEFPTKTQRRKTRQDDTFTFKACIHVQFPKKPEQINEKIRVQIKIVHRDLWFSTASKTATNEMTYDVRINQEESKYCNDVTVTRRQNANFELLMSYTISASLMDDPQNSSEFDSNRVLLSKQSILSLVGQESLKDCDGECKPKLLIELKPNMSNLYTVGSTAEGTFSFVIHNEGDTAYTACLLVQIKGAPLLRPPQGCTTDNGIDLICIPNIFLQNGIEWATGDITLDTRGLTSKNEKITVSYTLYNHCNNRTDPVELREETFSLISDVKGIILEGESDPGDVVDVFSEPIRGRHVYTITNSGPTTWEGVNADIVATKKGNVIYENIFVEIEDEIQISCQIVDATEDHLNANCYSIYLKKGSKFNVIIPFTFSPAADGEAATQNISTILKLHLKNDLMKSGVVTQLQCRKSTVPVWIIITASLFALLLLILLGYALFSFGFLKREKKGELKRLKTIIHKQKEQSMRHGSSNSNEEEVTEPANTSQEKESPAVKK